MKFILFYLLLVLVMVSSAFALDGTDVKFVVSEWNCDTLVGSEVVDTMNLSNMTVQNTASTAPGGVGDSDKCTFPGATDWMEADDNILYDMPNTNAGSLEQWILVDNTTGGQTFLEKRDPAESEGDYMLQWNTPSDMQQYMWSEKTPQSCPTFAFNSNTWTHVIVAILASNNSIEFFRDGVSICWTDAFDGDFGNTNAEMSFGQNGQNGGYIDGDADIIRVWNKSLQPFEAVAAYNLGDGLLVPFQGNIPPTISATLLNTTEVGGDNSSDEDVTSWVDATDPNGEAMQAHIRWFKDDVENFTLATVTAIGDNVFSLVDTLASGNLTAGDVWIAMIIVDDGEENATSWVNASITIVAPDVNVPSVGDNFSIPQSPLTYNDTTVNIDFFTNVTDDVAISTVNCESNFTRVLANKSAVNTNAGNYSCQYTNFGAGDYKFRLFAIDGVGKVNQTGYSFITVNPSGSFCYFNSTGNQANVSKFFINSSCAGENTGSLFRNGTNVNATENGNIGFDLPIGAHNYTINNTVSQNFTGNFTQFLLTASSPLIVEINLSINDRVSSAKFEYETTAEIRVNQSCASCQICLTIEDTAFGGTAICNTSTFLAFDYVINNTVVKNFTNPTDITLSSSELVWINNTDNRTDIYAMNINLTGSGNYPKGVRLDFGANGYDEIILPGRLIGDVINQNEFIFDGTNTIKNLTFGEKGLKTINVNVSTLNRANITGQFLISGFDADLGNEFSYTEVFNNTNTTTSNINLSGLYNASTPNGILENFEVNATLDDEWTQTFTNDIAANRDGSCVGDATYTGPTCDQVDDGWQTYGAIVSHQQSLSGAATLERNTLPFDSINNITWFEWDWQVSLTTICDVGCSLSASATGRISDGTNAIDIYARSTSGSGGSNDAIENITVVRQKTSNTWDVFVDGVPDSTISTSALDNSKNWTFQTYLNLVAFDFGGGEPITSTGSIKLNRINYGGIYLNRTNNGTEYFPNGTVTSNVLNSFPSNILGVQLTAFDDVPSGTFVEYYVSNTNGSVWTRAVDSVGGRTAFDSVGNTLMWRVNMSNTDRNITPIVYRIQTEVIPSSAENITVDVGGDANYEFNFSQVLNLSNSPQSVFLNTSPLADYIVSNCNQTLTCLIPIDIITDKAGTIQISSLNINQSINPLDVNFTSSQTLDNITIDTTFNDGILKMDDLKIFFRGDSNLTITATSDATGNSSFLDNSTEFSMVVKHSRFDALMKPPLTYFEWLFTSYEQKNVTPFGQTIRIPIINITGNAMSDPFNMTIQMNQTIDTCMNFTFGSNHSRYNMSAIFNYTTPVANLSNDGRIGLWNEVDLNCTGRLTSDAEFQIRLGSICRDCVKTSDWNDTNIVVIG